MTIKLQNNDLRLKPGETPSPERLAVLFDAIQTNFEQIAALFPLQQGDLAFVTLFLAATGTRRKAAFGKTEAEYPGASNDSNTVTVTHGLGTTPAVVLLGSKKNVGDSPWYTAVGETTLGVGVTDPFGKPASGTKTEISWLAIG